MLVWKARQLGGDWIHSHAEQQPDFGGAFFTGSIIERPPESELPDTSDVDIAVVITQSAVPAKLGKVSHEGVLVEVTYLPWEQFSDPEQVAETYYLAPSFFSEQIISDPSGRLRELQRRIAPTFAEPAAIRRRYENAIGRIESGLTAQDHAVSWHDQVTGWLFPVSVSTHVVLVAALRNATVRLRYLAARGVLAEHGQSDLYPRLLELIGCAGVSAAMVQHHLDQLAVVFDRAAELDSGQFFFSSDITARARPIAIRGSQELIDMGDHREAVFWIIATFARCMKILQAEAPGELARKFSPLFDEAVADLLTVCTPADLRRRADQARQLLPDLRRTAEAIIGETPSPLCR